MALIYRSDQDPITELDQSTPSKIERLLGVTPSGAAIELAVSAILNYTSIEAIEAQIKSHIKSYDPDYQGDKINNTYNIQGIEDYVASHGGGGGGSQGPRGYQGYRGYQGNPGNPGSPGSPGNRGYQGERGYQGPQGSGGDITWDTLQQLFSEHGFTFGTNGKLTCGSIDSSGTVEAVNGFYQQ